MTKLTDRQKLSLIDGLCICYEDGAPTHGNAKSILDDIYKVAHLSGQCSNPHNDWEKDAMKLAKELKKAGIVDVFREDRRKCPPHNKVITFDKSALKFLCEALKVPYDKNIIAFTKKGPVKDVFDLVDQLEPMCQERE